ncbi:MAG: hypothetical protein HYS51_00775 [Candidatus Zambryskibacteria bacterium]|nr:hypothetical protein [Candidatus Zambryskibacteria bacterium]
MNISKDQLVLPFGQGRAMVISYDYRARIFWVLMTVVLASLGVYMYAINATARHIALRQNMERQTAVISTSLDSLEFSYITLRNNVTIDTAYAEGFKEEKSPLFVTRNKAPSLSLNTVSR